MIYIAGIPDSGVSIIEQYNSKFLATTIEDLTSNAGIKGKLRNFGGKPDTQFIILSPEIYSECFSAAHSVLESPKTFQYDSDDGLRKFFEAQFGVLQLASVAPNPEVVVEDEPEIAEISISEYSQSQDDLSEQIETLRIEIRNKDSKITQLQNELDSFKSVGSADEASAHQIANLTRELKFEKTIIADLRNQVFELEDKAKKYDLLVSDLDKAEASVGTYKKELASVRSKLTESVKENNFLKGQNDELSNKVLEVDTLRGKLNILEAEKNGISKDYQESLSSIDELKAQVKALTQDCSALKRGVAEKDAVASKLAEVEKSLATAQVENAKLTERISQFSTLSEQVTALETEKSSTAAELVTLTTSLEAQQKENESLSTQLKSLSSQVEKLKTQFADANSKLNIAQAQVQQRDEQIAELNKSLGSVNEEKDSIFNELNNVKLLNSEQQEQLSDFRKQIVSYKKQLTTKQDNQGSLEEEVSSLRSQVDILSAENKEHKSKIATLNEEIVGLNDSLDWANNQTEDVEKKLNAAETRSKAKDAELGKYRKKVDELSKKIEELNTSTDKYKVDSFEAISQRDLYRKNLEDRDEEIEQLHATVKELADKLNAAEGNAEAIAELNTQIDRLQEKLVTKEHEIIDKEDKIESLSDEVTKRIHELQTAQGSLNDNSKQLKAQSDTIGKLEIEIQKKQKEFEDLQRVEKGLREQLESYAQREGTSATELKKLQAQVDNLTVESEQAQQGVSERTSEIYNLNQKVADLNLALEKAKAEVKSAQDIQANLQAQLEKIKTRLAESEKQLNEANSIKTLTETNLRVEQKKLVAKDEEIKRLTSERAQQVKDYEELSQKLNAQADECIVLREEVDKYKSQVIEIQSMSGTSSSELVEARGSLKQLQAKLDANTKLLSIREKELESVKSRCKGLEDEMAGLIDTAKGGSEAQSQILSLEGTIKYLQSALDEATNQVEILTSELDEKDEKLRKATNNFEGDKKVAELQSEIEEQKAMVDTIKKEYEGSISSYQSRLNFAQGDISKLRAELASTTSKLAVASRELQQVKGSVFSELAFHAAPKSALGLKLKMPLTSYMNIYVFASGSSESNLSLYKLLKKQVKSRGMNTHFILDLSEDSYLDRELGVKPNKIPLEWLQGTKPLNDFVSTTRYENTTVAMTSFGFINTLSYLEVDWERCLSDLSGMADIVIINLGSISDVVSSVLYSSFTTVMRGMIVVKATPINLRTLLLRLTGFKTVNNTFITCTDYSEETSKKLYDRLSSKFSTKVLADNEVLTL